MVLRKRIKENERRMAKISNKTVNPGIVITESTKVESASADEFDEITN